MPRNSYDTPVRAYAKGIGDAVADRTVNRVIDNKTGRTLNLDESKSALADGWGRREKWEEVAKRVAAGNSSLLELGASKPHPAWIESEFHDMHHHLRQASLLMSGRHLQHGDETQASRPMEVFTNCSTAALSFLSFYLLLNGSGVGRAYDDLMMKVDWRKLPIVVPVIDWQHADVRSGEINCIDARTARHFYAGREIVEFEVPDSREGWAKAIELMELMAFEGVHRDKVLILDFSKVRPRGSPIGGMQNRPASGPGPLMTAIKNVATLRDAGMEPWRATLYADHYKAECVLVGGARRAARMATKTWRDKSVLEFIEIKRGGFLWSANNSVTVDKKFWRYVEKVQDAIEKHGVGVDKLVEMCRISELEAHAFRVFSAVCECSYHDGTGEPGLINQDKLPFNPTGIETIQDGNFAESARYKLDKRTLKLTKALAKAFVKSPYKLITNPCGEIQLTMIGGYCVDGNTRILHREGYHKIKDLVGSKVEVWNGERWSMVTPFKTGEKQPLLRVSFSDGSHLDCTSYHRFSVKWSRQAKHFSEVQAKDLKVGHIVPTFRVDTDLAGQSVPNAYTYGAFLGDGWIERREHADRADRFGITLYEGKHHLPVCGVRGALKSNGGIAVDVSTLNKTKLYDLKNAELPDWAYGMDRESTLAFVRGWLDTDGLLHKDTGGVSISTNSKDRALGLQLILRRAGASYVSCKKVANAGDPTNYGPRKTPLWLVYIPASEAGMFSGERVATPTPIDLNKVVKQSRVVSVEPIEGEHATYCFTEPLRGMGVFGNVLTYQCVIADVVPYHAQTDDDAEDAFRVAARALIRTNLMDSLYAKEVRRTNRIGVGFTGIHEYAWVRFGYGWKDLVDEEKSLPFWQMLSRFKRAVKEEAASYAKMLGVVVPHTDTTVKPAGTTSKLFGLTEGAHLPSMREYLRWVQYRNDDPLIQELDEKGYPVKHLRTYEGTTIVGFPTQPTICSLGMGEALVTAAEATPEEQYEWLRLLEKWWIRGMAEDGVTPLEDTGNQVSYTLKYKPDAVSFEDFKRTLFVGQSSIRCCSVMPQTDTTAYEYQPEEPVTKHEFEQIANAIKESEIKEDVDFAHVDCASGACPIDFNKKAA